MSTLAFAEQNLHHLRHVDLQEHIRIAQERSKASKDNRLDDGVLGQIFLPERCDPKIPFDHECAVQSTKNTKTNKEDELKKVPRAVILHLEHDQLPRSERVQRLASVSDAST